MSGGAELLQISRNCGLLFQLVARPMPLYRVWISWTLYKYILFQLGTYNVSRYDRVPVRSRSWSTCRYIRTPDGRLAISLIEEYTQYSYIYGRNFWKRSSGTADLGDSIKLEA